MDVAAAMEIDENHYENSVASTTLIEDVLSKVFEFLPCKDRKNAKLVCKQWFQVLSRKRFAQKEAFFFPHFYGYPTIMKVVDDCYRDKPMNLKFELHQFAKNSQILWRKCGSKIESLQFIKCSFYSDMLLHIFTHCVNLKHIRVEECGTPSHPQCSFVSSLIFPQEYQSLNHGNLTFLDLCVGIPLNLNDLMFIASAFPKLKTLKVVLACVPNGETNSFSAFVELLLTRFSQLNTLHVEFSFENDISFPSDFSSLSLSNFSRLKTVSFSIHAPLMDSAESIKKILCYKCWTAITVSTSTQVDMQSNLAGVISTLEQNLLLEKLEITLMFSDLLKFWPIFTALVKSSLKYLCLQLKCSTPIPSENYIFQETDQLFMNLSKNHTLLHLNLVTNIPKLNSLFLEYFPNVRDLEGELLMNLITIFEHQENLRSLRTYSNIGVLNCISSTFPIKSIEILEIGSIVELEEEVLNVQFPNLLYLTFEDNPKLRRESKDTNFQSTFKEMPEWFPKKFPKLKGIEIRWFRDFGSPNLEELILFFQSFQNLQQLRYISLYIQSSDNTLEAHWKNILSSNLFRFPTLKALWITNGNFKHYYCYDVLIKKFRAFSQRNIFYSTPYDDYINFKSYWLNGR